MELDYDTVRTLLLQDKIDEVVAHGKDVVPALIKAIGDPELKVGGMRQRRWER